MANTDVVQEVAPEPSVSTDLNAQAVASLEQALAAAGAPEAPTQLPAADVVADVPAPDKPATPPASDPALADINARMAEVARKEMDAVRERQELKAAHDAIKADAARVQAEHATLQQALKENPLKALEALGWDLESLVRSAATQQTPEAVRVSRAEQQLAELKAELAKRDEAAAAREAEGARLDAHRRLMTEVIPAGIDTVKDSIPTLRAWLGSDKAVVDAVYDLMGREYQRTNGTATLEPADAAKQLEAQMCERVKRLPGAKVTPPTPKTVSNPQPVTRPSAALTNQQTQHRGSPPPVSTLDRAALDQRAAAELAAMMQSAQ